MFFVLVFIYAVKIYIILMGGDCLAINKAMRAALKVLSYPDIDVKKNYKLERQFINITKKN